MSLDLLGYGLYDISFAGEEDHGARGAEHRSMVKLLRVWREHLRDCA